jgi:hypothetical protein
MGFKKIDWKFFAGFLVSVLAVGISLYLPRAELTAHALTMSLVSSSALQPPNGSHIQDLQIMLNGAEIENPYVSSFTITNIGSKPIASSDFETPITLSIQGPSTLITAQITGSTPKGIPVELKIEDGKMKILPFLSNPNDEITFALVTSGVPQLLPTARIAGVSEIIYEDLTQPRARPLAALTAVLVGSTCFFLYTFYLLRGRLFARVDIGYRIRLATIFCLAISGTQALQLVVKQLASTVVFGAVTVVLTVVIGIGGGLIAVKIANRTDP